MDDNYVPHKTLITLFWHYVIINHIVSLKSRKVVYSATKFEGDFMKNFKRSRNLSLLAGLCFIISTIIALVSNQFILVPILYAIASIPFFAGAYTYHKRITKDNKD
jgi:hypothetical protein